MGAMHSATESMWASRLLSGILLALLHSAADGTLVRSGACLLQPGQHTHIVQAVADLSGQVPVCVWLLRVWRRSQHQLMLLGWRLQQPG